MPKDWVTKWVFMNPKEPFRAVITPLGEDELAEVIAVVYDPSLPKAAILRDSFWAIVDPNSMGPVTLHLGRRPGGVLVRDVEMRFIDR